MIAWEAGHCELTVSIRHPFTVCCLQQRFGPVPTALIADLVGAAAPTLEVLKFGRAIEDWFAPKNPDLPAVVDAVSRCTRVRELAVDRQFVPVLAGLPRLETLQLFVACAERGQESVHRLRAALAACEPLPALRCMLFELIQLHLVKDEDNPDDVRRKCEKRVARFGRRRPDVVVSCRIEDE